MRKNKSGLAKAELPYKRSATSSQISEDVEKATKKYISGCPHDTNKYEMLLVATARSRDLYCGAPSTIHGDHGPLVTAMLEIEAGEVTWDYINSRNQA